MKRILDRVLTQRWLPVLLATIAILFILPSVWTGWQLDDITHRYFLLGHPDFQGKTLSAMDMFAFLSGDTARSRAMMDLGLLPWWTVDGLRLRFWRPLTGLSHWLDYASWPNNAVLMHLQNLFWFGVLVAVVALLYRRFLGLTWVAGLAALLYAIDDAHGLPAGWLAGRNTIMASLFGMLVLLVHDQWRRDGWRPGAWLGLLFLVLGLFAGELALGVFGYLIAYAIFLDPATPRARILALVPYGSTIVAWLYVYHQLGYGTWGSGFYVDPIAEPLAFVVALIQRAPILLLDQFGFPPAVVYLFLTSEQITLLWLWALVFLGLLIVLFLPMVRQDRTARFWSLGLILSTPLICATLPSGRLLFFVGLGGMGLVAQWIAAYESGVFVFPTTRSWRALGRITFAALLVVHIVIAPLLLPWNSTSATVAEPYLQRAAKSIPDDPGIEQKTLVIVNPPVMFYSNYILAVRILNNNPIPRRVRALTPGATTLHITRTDDRNLVIRPDGGFLAYPFDNVFRGPSNPMGLGSTVELTGMTVRVTKLTTDKRPEEAAFEFSKSIEDSSLMWLAWHEGRYVPFKLPSVGSTTVLPPAIVF